MLLVTLLVTLAAPARAQADPFSELGIPASSPYEDPALKAAKAAKAAPKPVHPLEAVLESRLAADLEDILAARAGLSEVLDYAKTRPQAFPPAPVTRAELFDEWRDEAGLAWARAADLMLALDAQAARYAEAPRLSTPRGRGAAFTALALSFAARARFLRAFALYGENDPLLKALFDAEGPALGLPAGAFTALTARMTGDAGAKAAGLARAARQAFGKGPRPQGPVFQRAERALDEDLKALPAEPPKRFSLTEAAEAAGPVWGMPAVFAPAPSEAADRPVPAFLPPPLTDAVTVSSQVAYARDVARRWFRLDASSAPAVLSRQDARAFAEALRPGDVLLARRWSAGAPGQGGWWGAAALYAGSDAARRAEFGDDSLSAELRVLAPGTVQTSTSTPPEDLPTVFEAGPGGVVLTTLARFAAAESVAALRPRLEPEAKAAAVRGAAGLLGRPYDPAQRPGGTALSEGELVARAYQGALALAEEPAAGPRAPSPGGLAAAFDAAFGTPRQAFDFVAGFVPGAEAEDRRMTLERFRALTREPKWILRTPKENAP
ncbi:hypothetical protein EPO15_09510 [bacterium]|nr:MAG: hypothetical protein EPO15_09510 [bacterium]